MRCTAFILSNILLGSTSLYAASNIQNDIYNLRNKTNNANDVFYSKNMGATYKGTNGSFTQKYNNGTLIIGNDTKNANVTSTHWFGSAGYIGYITANFNAKDIYLTGTIGSGNNWGTGGGASLSFNSNNELTLDSAKLQINNAGSQNSSINLSSTQIIMHNSNIETATGTITIGSNTTQKVTLDNTNITMSGGNVIIKAQDSALNFGGIKATAGTLDLSGANYSSLTVQNGINVSDFRFISNELDMTGNIANGRFSRANLGNGSDFSADFVILRDRNNTLKANKVQITDLEFRGGSTLGFGSSDPRNLTITATDEINLTNLYFAHGSNIGNGYNGVLNASNKLNIGDIHVGSQGAGISSSNFTINAKEGSQWHDINVGNIFFTNDNATGASQTYFYMNGKNVSVNNILGRQQNHIKITATENLVIKDLGFTIGICITDSCGGTINLEGKNIFVQNVTSGNSSENGIQAGNVLGASGENFYAGTIYAHGLVTAGSNSTLDLSGVTKTTFIDTFSIRTGTLKASNFHFNNFSVVKGNSHSNVDLNIGKSFVNFFETDLGTSTVDSADIYFRNGGDILNVNLMIARVNSKVDMGSIQFANLDTLNNAQANIILKNGIINTLVSTMGQTAISGTSAITANALNINNLLHIKDGGKHSGSLNITLSGNENVVQDFSKYLQIDVSSSLFTQMSAQEIQNLIEANKAQITADNQNASGTYITTSDGKHYLVLPDILQHEGIINGVQAANGGNILIEQTQLTQGALNNYGTILVDSGFVSGNAPVLNIQGNVNNYNTIDIGANGRINITGNFENKGKLIFHIQADPSNTTNIKNATLNITGNTTLDISPGTPGAFQTDISDANALANLKIATPNTDAISDVATYKLINVTNGSINYSYTQGDYTTTFNKNSLTTNKNDNSPCVNANCVITDNNTHKQETDFSIHNKENPWDMDKAQTDNNGNKIENGVGGYDNEGNPIQKPSQSDKKCGDGNGYCGFGDATIQQDQNKTEQEKEANRGYDYAQEKMKNSFAITYKGGSIEGKYLSIEKVVTDNLIGFRVIKKDLTDFTEGNTDTPLCTSKTSTFDCALYMEAGGNNSWINAIKKESANSYEILKNLFYDDRSSLVFLVNLDQSLAASRNLEYFLEVGRTLDTAFQHVSNLEDKASTLHTLTFAMESARLNRLAKSAAVHGVGYEYLAFNEYQENLKKAVQKAQELKFASADNDFVNDVWFDTLADLIMRFNKREEHPHHIWTNALGNLNFSGTGTSQLYGFNAGYDYFIESLKTTFGGYGGYGYGTFQGSNNGFTSNTSNNIFAGVYSRTFVGNQEIDVMLNTAFGMVNEKQQSQINNLDLLDLFADNYAYTLSNIEMNVTYGYAFFLQKGYIVKPFIGMSYYVLHSSDFTRSEESSVVYKLNTTDNTRQTLNINLGLDGRKYFVNQSYIFLLAELKQDALVIQNNVDSNGHTNTSIGDATNHFAMQYKTNMYRSYVYLTGGGEYSFGRWYLNGSLSFQSSIFDKNFGLGMNLGGRMIF